MLLQSNVGCFFKSVLAPLPQASPAFLFWSQFFRAFGCGARRGAACTLRRKVCVPAGLCGACSGRSKSRSWQVIKGSIFRRARAYQDNRNKHKKRAAAFRKFSAVYNSSHLAWSPGHPTPRAWSTDHLATSHLGPSRVQQQ